MGDAHNITTGGRPQRSQITEATVSSDHAAPSHFSDPLYVQAPWNPNVAWTITRWPAIHGATLPAQGAFCVLLVTDNGNRICTWWDGEHS
jgi:hypothetical protein